jgi:hypothetical protein
LIQQRERGCDGLTLPFLIGSQEYLPETNDKQSIRDLILDMTEKNSFETCLRFCMGTQTFIFEIRKSANAVYFPTMNQSEQDGLSVALFHNSQFGDTVEELIEELEDLFQDPIQSSEFSAEPNVEERAVKWRKFSEDEDIPFIKNSFEVK